MAILIPSFWSFPPPVVTRSTPSLWSRAIEQAVQPESSGRRQEGFCTPRHFDPAKGPEDKAPTASRSHHAACHGIPCSNASFRTGKTISERCHLQDTRTKDLRRNGCVPIYCGDLISPQLQHVSPALNSPG